MGQKFATHMYGTYAVEYFVVGSAREKACYVSN